MEYRYKPKRITNIVFYGFILIGVLLTVVRWIFTFNNHIVVFNEEITSHISNFSLSFLFYLAIGFMWILQGVSFKKVILLGGLLVVGNLLCETVMGFMNTPDIMDAIYGLAGTVVGFVFLAVTKKYGLNINGENG